MLAVVVILAAADLLLCEACTNLLAPLRPYMTAVAGER